MTQPPHDPNAAQYGAPDPGWQQQMAPQGGSFFGALFDFSFNRFITPSIIKVLYILGLVAIVLGYLVALIGGFTASTVLGVVILIFGPVLALLYLALWRVTLEFYYAVVRMSEDIHHRR